MADKMGHIVADRASEIVQATNTLTALLGERFPVSAEEVIGAPVWETLQKIKRAAVQCSRECEEVRRDILLPPGDYKEIDVEQLVRDVADGLRAKIGSRDVRLVGPPETNHRLHTFASDVKHVIEEMLSNAIESSKPKGVVEVDVRKGLSGFTVDVVVTDKFNSMDWNIVKQTLHGEKLTERPNAGWGLALARTVAQSLGASLTVSASSGRTALTLRLPMTAEDLERVGEPRRQ